MSKIRNIFIVLFSVLLVGCSDKQTEINKAKIQLTKVGEKKIYLDSLTPNRSRMLQSLVWKGASSIAMLNGYNNTINIYDYEKGILSESFIFEKEGNNGVGIIKGFGSIVNLGIECNS
jgi:hypothetical protein